MVGRWESVASIGAPGGAENDGPSKLQGMKLQDMKLQDMTRIDCILFNFSFSLHCDAEVAAMELCNVIMK